MITYLPVYSVTGMCRGVGMWEQTYAMVACANARVTALHRMEPSIFMSEAQCISMSKISSAYIPP